MIESKGMAYIYKFKDGEIQPCEPIEVGLPNKLTDFGLLTKSSVDFSITQEAESKGLDEFLKLIIPDPEPPEGQKVLVRAYGFDKNGEPMITNKIGYATQNEEGDLCLTFY